VGRTEIAKPAPQFSGRARPGPVMIHCSSATRLEPPQNPRGQHTPNITPNTRGTGWQSAVAPLQIFGPACAVAVPAKTRTKATKFRGQHAQPSATSAWDRHNSATSNMFGLRPGPCSRHSTARKFHGPARTPSPATSAWDRHNHERHFKYFGTGGY
jgi:hypothetical protein